MLKPCQITFAAALNAAPGGAAKYGSLSSFASQNVDTGPYDGRPGATAFASTALGAGACCACAAAPQVHAAGAVDLANCCTPGDKDFPKVGGNLGNQNYSSLRQINKGLINKLGGAWVNRIEGGLTPRGDRGDEFGVLGEAVFGHDVQLWVRACGRI